jgi:hypothetical protein
MKSCNVILGGMNANGSFISCKKNQIFIRGGWGASHVEEGSNTSIVSLRVVGGDKKGSPESEAVKYGG